MSLPHSLRRSSELQYDRWLLIASLLLICIGLVLINSASIMESFAKYGDEWILTKKHLFAIVVALGAGMVSAAISTEFLSRNSLKLLFVSIGLLGLVLVIGREVNEAKRWINLGFFNLQPAEVFKLCWILYFASFVSRKVDEVNTALGFFKSVVILFVPAVLLLMQPDFGTLVVVSVIAFGMLWVVGAGLIKYLVVVAAVGVAFFFLVVTRPYRMLRITSFLNPWEDPFGSGYQLTQSLMAFGRGGLTGEGLGNSLQKLGYLPEAHTDFVTSILGEELGFLGMCMVILLEFFIVCKAIHLSFKILHTASLFQGYVAFGIGVMFCMQTVINIGAASGGLPTKGLTLPLVSFGGSSLIVCCAAMGILMRIDYEWRHRIFGALPHSVNKHVSKGKL
ncbi:MAG: putative lipid II flippase FtsW [Succinivibrio sp.]|nr:putative lipid II flippase FtsW [Succinivibrio sp.]